MSRPASLRTGAPDDPSWGRFLAFQKQEMNLWSASLWGVSYQWNSDRNQPVWRHLFEGEESARADCALYVRGVSVPELPLRLVKEIRNWKNQILLAIGFAGLVQIGLHFWH
jgi:hypothetical protein